MIFMRGGRDKGRRGQGRRGRQQPSRNRDNQRTAHTSVEKWRQDATNLPAQSREVRKLLEGIGTPPAVPFKADSFQLDAIAALEFAVGTHSGARLARRDPGDLPRPDAA